MARLFYMLVIVLICCLACQNPNADAVDTTKGAISAGVNEPDITKVSILRLEPRSFSKEIISQGKIEARYLSDVTFEVSGRIEKIMVETGQRVAKGQMLAQLNDFEQQHELQKLAYQIEQAKIQFEAKLISLGYTLADSIDIPPAIWKTARLESNLDGLLLDHSLAKYQLENTKVKAPIAGIIGEVEAQAGNLTSAYQKLCTIIDDQRLDAVFPILEQELPMVQKGQTVSVRPLNQTGKNYKAGIRAIMPQVDQHGMVKVFARLLNPGGSLLDGMNITAIIRDQKGKQLVVPKSAVVDRQGRLVVFVHRDGQAHWKYVQIGLENSESYTITEGLETGDEVIINNNFHLSHLEKIEVVKALDKDAEPL